MFLVIILLSQGNAVISGTVIDIIRGISYSYLAMRQCAKCGKSFQISGTRIKLRGKFNPTKSGKKRANLQWTRLLNGKRTLVCVKCLKTLTRRATAKA